VACKLNCLGPSHARIYKVGVNFLGKRIGLGTGDRYDSLIVFSFVLLRSVDN